MISHASKILHSLAFVILAFSFLACGLTVQTSNAVNTSIPTASLTVETATATIQSAMKPTYASPSAIPTLGLTATPALPLVTITAINGDLYIRRGSGSDFNPIGVLVQGQTATVLGRDILNQWLYIPIPSQAGKFGWVSTLTIYSSISGQTMDLPVVDSDLAVPAFIQNCSTHNMMVQPTGVILPPWINIQTILFNLIPANIRLWTTIALNITRIVIKVWLLIWWKGNCIGLRQWELPPSINAPKGSELIHGLIAVCKSWAPIPFALMELFSSSNTTTANGVPFQLGNVPPMYQVVKSAPEFPVPSHSQNG